MQNRFIHRGVSRVYFVPAVVTTTAPTRAEINAGTNLTPALQAVGGFAVDAGLQDVGPVGARFIQQLPMASKVSAPCTLLLFEDKTSTTYRTAVAVGTAGFIILAPYGDVVGRRCEVWPVTVASIVNTWPNDVGAPFRVLFAPRGTPTQNATLPA